ncbi:MAG: rRNA maturation RNase YbeY [Verrucomicrobiota bacterium]|jgi:probable rRNA maturation factor
MENEKWETGNGSLTLRNRQRTRRLDLPLLRRIAWTLLHGLMRLDDFDLGIFLLGATEMTRLNQTFLGRRGPTDVLTFDYLEKPGPAAGPAPSGQASGGEGGSSAPLHGEILVCVEAAAAHARQFRTTWQSELVRCIVHGLLHLRGFDDRRPAQRRKMKRAEDHYLRQLARRFDLARLARQEAHSEVRSPRPEGNPKRTCRLKPER